MESVTGQLTTHVLDTAQGLPAVGMTVELWSVPNAKRTLLKCVVTNSQGRTAQPLLLGNTFQRQTYELVFQVGAYFQRQPVALPNPPFLDQIPIRFNIDRPQEHYHVPLLVSPWSYSTYRGS